MERAPLVLDRVAAGMKTLSPLIFGHSTAMALMTAVVLGIPDIIAKAGHEGTLSLQEIAAELPSDSVDEQALSHFMRALVQYGISSAKRGSEPEKRIHSVWVDNCFKDVSSGEQREEPCRYGVICQS